MRFEDGEVEAVVHQPIDEMNGKLAVDRIVARLAVLEEALPVLHVPFREALVVLLVLLVAVEDRIAVIDRKGRPAVLQIGFVLVVAHNDQRIELGAVERLAQTRPSRRAPCSGARPDARGATMSAIFGIGLLQKLGVGDGPAFLVAVLDLLIGLEKARQRLVGREQHRRVG